MKHPDLETIFRCDDQSAMIHNYAASVDPTPGAWSHHAEPQSALGKVSFPEVLTITRGEVYLFERPGVIVEQMLDHHTWVPWAYDGANEEIAVARSIGKDIWQARIESPADKPALLLLECVPGGGLAITAELTEWGMRFRWEDKFEIHLRVSGAVKRIDMSDDPAQLRRRFAGFDDVPLNPAHLGWTWQYLRRCWLGVEFTGPLEMAFVVDRPGETVSTGISGESLRKSERERWQTFFDEQVPPLQSDDPVLRDTYYFAWQTLWANRAAGGSGLLPAPFTSPARLHYGSQWWWDEVFHAAIYRHCHNPAIAYDFLENFRRMQAEDGMIPGSLSFTGTPVTMSMQPPVIGFILQLLCERPGWPADIRPLYEMLHRHIGWHYTTARDTDQDGLVEYHHCFETSIDQSQRWDAQKINPHDVISPLRPVEAIDFNAWISVLWDVLGDMAEALGDAAAAASHRRRGEDVMALIEEHMWDEEDGLYYDIDAQTHRKNKVKSPFSFMPMLSRHARTDRIARMVDEHLANPRELWPAWPLCSVSMDTPTFDPIDMFRGATWVNVNWMVIEGLFRQGYAGLARTLAHKTVELVGPRYRDGKRIRSPRIWEWYHPHTGESLGNCQYSWSALVVDMILRFLEG